MALRIASRTCAHALEIQSLIRRAALDFRARIPTRNVELHLRTAVTMVEVTIVSPKIAVELGNSLKLIAVASEQCNGVPTLEPAFHDCEVTVATGVLVFQDGDRAEGVQMIQNHNGGNRHGIGPAAKKIQVTNRLGVLAQARLHISHVERPKAGSEPKHVTPGGMQP